MKRNDSKCWWTIWLVASLSLGTLAPIVPSAFADDGISGENGSPDDSRLPDAPPDPRAGDPDMPSSGRSPSAGRVVRGGSLDYRLRSPQGETISAPAMAMRVWWAIQILKSRAIVR